MKTLNFDGNILNVKGHFNNDSLMCLFEGQSNREEERHDCSCLVMQQSALNQAKDRT